MSKVFNRKKKKPPQILVLYEKSDEKLHDDVMNVLSSLQCGGFVNVKSWYLCDYQKDDFIRKKTRELILESTITLVCCSPSLLRSHTLKGFVKKELIDKHKKAFSVIPVVISPLLNYDYKVFETLFEPFLDRAFPSDGRAIFYQRAHGEVEQLLIQLSEQIITALEEKYFQPKAYHKKSRSNIFISYAKADYEIAQTIRLYLASVGIATWMEKCHLRGEGDWIDRTEAALKKAWASIVVLSKNAKRSQYVNYEWPFALGAGCSLVPVLAKNGVNPHPRLVPLDFLLWCFQELENCPWPELVDRLEQVYLA